MFLRKFDNRMFGFVTEEVHTIEETDIEITDSDYALFFDLQNSGKQFRLKETATGLGLFDMIEEFAPESTAQEAGTDEHLLDLEFRVSMLELGGL